MIGALGVDKIALWVPTDAVTFQPHCSLTVVPGNYDAATGEVSGDRHLCTYADGVEKRGKLALLQTDNYALAVRPPSRCGSGVVQVHYSAGAFNETNLNPLSREECMDAAKIIERDLCERGAVLSLEGARLYRVDITRNVQLDEPVSSYATIFHGVGARKRVNKTDFGGTGFIIGNTRWQEAFYDKGAQMKENGYAPTLCPVNTLRPELRLLAGAPILERLGARTLSDLRHNWELLKPVYLESLKREVFRHQSAPEELPFMLDLDMIAERAVKQYDSRRWHQFKSDLADAILLEQLGLSAAKNWVPSRLGYDTQSDSDRRQRDRIHKELEAVSFTMSMAKESPTGSSQSKMYHELQSKVLAA